jgi:trimeric autotransporter adhesin
VLYSNTTGFENTATGAFGLYSNTTGFYNTATGGAALYSNTTGGYNTATGLNALLFNTTDDNTATGAFALYSNTTGRDNTAAGLFALYSNTTGYYNTAGGSQALFSNTGNDNTAAGAFALFSNHGDENTATGYAALYSNISGSNNTATGFNALAGNTTGSTNIALGYQAGVNLTTGDNNIDIGNTGAAGESGVIRIGTTGTHTTTFIAGIRGVPIGSAIAVGVSPGGQLGVKGSSRRFKEAIKPMDKASEAILSLKPVTFHYKKAIDPGSVLQFGLVAEDVAKVNPDLVACDADGKPFTVRYDEINAMLLNEFLKEHKRIEEQQSKIDKQQAAIAREQKQIEALTAGLQKVSTQLELRKSEPQTVLNNH